MGWDGTRGEVEYGGVQLQTEEMWKGEEGKGKVRAKRRRAAPRAV